VSQTTNTLGSFSTANTGGWQSYSWVPLRDSAAIWYVSTSAALKRSG
jgi:hypothetical protein